MKVHDLIASSGESFAFVDESGIAWSGACARMLPYPDRTQIEGTVAKGPLEYCGAAIVLIIDTETEEATIGRVGA